MRRFYFIILIFTFTQGAWSQDFCGTYPTQDQLDFIENIQAFQKASRNTNSNVLVNIPIQFFLVARNDGSGIPTSFNANSVLASLNSFYINSNLQFFFHSDPITVLNTELYDYNSSEQTTLAGSRNISGVINVYFTNTIVSNGRQLCGYTYFPPSEDHIFVNYSCTDGLTLEHEVGHYFTLFHTHGKTNTGTTDELVDGSNCESAGDDLCDTPADPNLSGNVSGCTYTGSASDANGQKFQPDVTNIMSYAPGNCVTRFTKDQYARIRAGFELGRSYLNFESSSLLANFSVDQNDICIGDAVKFSSNSFGATRWIWEFEGGIPASSVSENPTVIFENPGLFSVTLTVFDAQGNSAEITRTDFVTVVDPVINALQDSFYTDLSTSPDEVETVNPDIGITFTIGDFDQNGSGAYYMNNFEYFTESLPNKDLLVLDYFNNLGIRKFNISFDYSYAYRLQDTNFDLGQIEIYDTLKFGLSSSCSFNPQPLWKAGGLELSTAGGLEDPFFPAANDWENVQIEYIPTGEVTKFYFESVSYNGNNLFIDNIKIEPDFNLAKPTNFRLAFQEGNLITLRWLDNSTNETGFVVEKSIAGGPFIPVDTLAVNTQIYTEEIDQFVDLKFRIKSIGIKEFSSEYSEEVYINGFVLSSEQQSTNIYLNLYPNPAKETFRISSTDRIERYSIIDFNGREIMNNMVKDLNQVDVSIDNYPKGLYFIRVWLKDDIIVKKIILY